MGEKLRIWWLSFSNDARSQKGSGTPDLLSNVGRRLRGEAID
jgi:hypothetical protein